jgi:2-C-methyl-D-erythritol 2,4-cyclodiphosphate synthase
MLKVENPNFPSMKKRPRLQRAQPARHFRPSTLDFRLPFRLGYGNDVHRLVSGRKLVLGGVRIPFSKGPLSHSDGDALAHALTDALLGAAALGDIGTHFPDTSPKWRNAPGLLFLRHTRKLLHSAGFTIANLDVTVSLERPKLAPHAARIRRNVARALGIEPGQVSVKAKTGEGLDAVGQGLALRADAVALIQAVDQIVPASVAAIPIP